MKPHKPTIIVLAIALLTLFAGNIVAAPPGTAFIYQGRLTSGGLAANGPYDFAFTVYDASSGGSVVGGPLTNSAVPVSNGLFSVTLDFGSGIFTGDARWLDISARTNGGNAFVALTPRQPLLPTPYAIYTAGAGSAAVATMANTTAPNAVNGASIQANSITGDKIVNGTLTDANISSSGISGDKIIGGDLQAARLKVGLGHNLSGQYATIAGGFQNTISNADWSVDAIGGGSGNAITNAGNATIAGGYQNVISGNACASVAGGANNTALGFGAAVGGGADNTASNWVATVSGGAGNSALAGTATIGGGQNNAILQDAQNSVIAGGGDNTIQTNSGFGSIGGGWGNIIGPDSWTATISGGQANAANGSGAFIGGGWNNTNSGWCGTIPGGWSNLVSGNFALAAGYRAKANHQGAFVWADSTDADFASSGNDQFLIRATGGVGINTNNPNGAALNVNGTVVAANFAGSGAGLTGISASQLTNGTLPLAQLPGVVLTNGEAGTVTFNGDLILPVTGTIYSGVNTLMHTDGNQNFFAGPSAGNLTLTGYRNTANGAQALFSNTSGADNTANGYMSLNNNTTGADNTANGVWALCANTTGNCNTANGVWALYANTSGEMNAANGYQALTFNMNGSYNTANGVEALYVNTSGSANTANGFQALYANTTGSNNTANGYQALYSDVDGVWNTANGAFALYSNTSGVNNTANGAWALYATTNGFGDTANGTGALQCNTSGNGNTANGYMSLNNNTTAFNNTADGYRALRNSTTGSWNIALGANAGINITTGNANIDIGNDGDSTDTNIIRIGYHQTATYLTGTVYAPGRLYAYDVWAWEFQQESDRNAKENFKSVDNKAVLAKVAALPVTEWNYKMDQAGVRHIGPMAQDFHAAFNVGSDDKHIATVDESGVALAAIQGLNQKLEETCAENADLKARLERLEQLINAQNGGAK